MPQQTLLQIAQANGSDGTVGLVEETIKAHPELQFVPARTIRGTGYKTLVRTGLGRTTGSFRDANAGSDPIRSNYENRQVETFILEARIHCDKAVADRYEDGWQAFLGMEAQGVMQGEMQGLGRQFYYGRGTGNNKGHPGLIDMYDRTTMEVDAGGTTANTGSSAWLVKFGPQAVQWVWGADGTFEVGPNPPRVETLYDASSKPYDGYVQRLLAYPGLQCASIRAAVRIKNLTADSGKGLTDALIAAGMAKFPVGERPDAIFIARRSSLQLQISRTVTINAGPGAANPAGNVGNVAPIPDSAFGVPVYMSDSISTTESLTL